MSGAGQQRRADPVPLGALDHAGHQAPELAGRRVAGGGDLRDHVGGRLLLPAPDRGLEQRVPVLEVPVEAALGGAEAGGERFDADRRQAAVRGRAQGGGDPVVPGEPPPARCFLIRHDLTGPYGSSIRHRMESGRWEAAMGAGRYDVIVVGARVAGAATAMLLARQGLRALAVDRVSFPSDTISSHQLQVPGVALLRGRGLLDKLTAAGTPPSRRVRFDAGGGLVMTARFPAYEGVDALDSPPRTLLDTILVEAARAAG